MILAPLLTAHGFVFTVTAQGQGSGGRFAAGRFVRGDQFIELHARDALGLVSYGWGATTLSHRDYLGALGVRGSYPGFSSEPLDGFRHLLEDLQGPAAGFVRGTDRGSFDALAVLARQRKPPRLP
ncbi:MAG TPA: hypothetical protein VGC06_08495 [Actinomycetes bacterium]